MGMHRSQGATALLGLDGFVVGAQLEVDGEVWLSVETDCCPTRWLSTATTPSLRTVDARGVDGGAHGVARDAQAVGGAGASSRRMTLG